jgi:Protein of unknown function (DUF2000)
MSAVSAACTVRLYAHAVIAGQQATNGVLRCVIVVDESLPPGLAANATGMLAVTLGATVAGLPGAALVDADGDIHPGLIPQGLTVLRAPADRLGDLRARAAASEDVGVIDFPTDCQQTTDYGEVRRRVAGTLAADLRYLAILLYGPRRAVGRLTGNLALLR